METFQIVKVVQVDPQTIDHRCNPGCLPAVKGGPLLLLLTFMSERTEMIRAGSDLTASFLQSSFYGSTIQATEESN